jgi:uncharacterized protein
MSLNLLVIQPTSFCNLNCSYCYLPEFKRLNKEQISADILEEIFKKVLRNKSVVAEKLQVLWLAGEPLAAGVELFDHAMNLIKKHNVFGKTIKNSVQTNGTLINQKWCDFFKLYDFNVGISLDGPPFIHNKNRLNWNEKESYHQVIRGVKLLHKNGLKFNGLCTVTRETLRYPDEVFNTFYEMGFNAIGFNPVQIKVANLRSSLIDQERGNSNIELDYKEFMSRIYDLYILHNREMHVREFNDIMQTLYFKLESPSFQKKCDPNIGIEILTIRKDGEISTFCPEMADGTSYNNNAFSIGNITQIQSLEELFNNENYRALQSQIETGVKNCLRTCEYYDYCGGGYPSNKFYENGYFDSTETKQCRLQVKILKDLIIQKLALS